MTSTKTQTSKKSAPVATASQAGCGCGCGENVPSNRTFRPGHDARLVSLLAKAITGAGHDRGYVTQILEIDMTKVNDQQAEIDDATKAVSTKFGSALAGKFFNAAMNSWHRQVAGEQKRSEKAAKKAESKSRRNHPVVEGAQVTSIVDTANPDAELEVEETWTVGPDTKVGRWTFPTRVSNRGRKQRNQKANGKGSWIDM